jgi:hypothetical protein
MLSIKRRVDRPCDALDAVNEIGSLGALAGWLGAEFGQRKRRRSADIHPYYGYKVA